MQKIKDTQKEKKVKSVQSITGNYPVGDFLTRLKNAGLAGKKIVTVPSTNLIKAVAKTLMEERYVEEMGSDKEMLTVQLAFRKKEPLLTKVRLVSKPGLRIYIKVSELEARKEPSILIISTPRGVMSSRGALKKRLGGEVIAEIL